MLACWDGAREGVVVGWMSCETMQHSGTVLETLNRTIELSVIVDWEML